MQTPKFPSIPVPDAEVKSLRESVMTLKKCVDMLTGSDGLSRDGVGADRFAPHVFITPDLPTALHDGDLWLCTGVTWTFNIWDGTDWILLLTVPSNLIPVRAYRARPDLDRRRRVLP
jgi:hypothetical protein